MLKIKQSECIIEIPFETETETVSSLKERISSLNSIQANEIRLIYSGRVLKDEDCLSVYKIAIGSTIHLVKGRSANAPVSAPVTSAPVVSAPPSTTPSPLPGGFDIASIMSNPAFIDMAIQANPQLAQMMTPEMRQMMQTPQFQQMVSKTNLDERSKLFKSSCSSCSNARDARYAFNGWNGNGWNGKFGWSRKFGKFHSSSNSCFYCPP